MTPTIALLIAHELALAVHAPEGRAREVAGALVTAGATEAETRELLAVAWRESSLRLAVERCEPEKRDASGRVTEKSGIGRAGEVGLWQAKAPRGGALCAPGGIRAQALEALRHWRTCAGGGEVRMQDYLGRGPVTTEAAVRANLVDAMAAEPR